MKLILSCEHGGNEIPKEYEQLFTEASEALQSHRGYDPGTLDLFMELREYASFSHFNVVSRLLVEMNRSVHHRQLFSEFSRDLSADAKAGILETYYFPYRNKIEEAIRNALQEGENARVLHLSIHSFTPELHGEVRNADIGLLFDPGRKEEREFCKKLRSQLKEQDPVMNVRFNYPYLGKSDGFTTYLRKKFPEKYLGIEVEVNQKFVRNNKMANGIKEIFTTFPKLWTLEMFPAE